MEEREDEKEMEVLWKMTLKKSVLDFDVSTGISEAMTPKSWSPRARRKEAEEGESIALYTSRTCLQREEGF